MDTLSRKTIVVMSLTFSLYIFIQTIQITLLFEFGCEHTCANIVNKEVNKVLPWDQELEFHTFDNETGTSDGRYIVPNTVHFAHFGQNSFDFPRAVCVLSALKNQRPDKLFIHTDQESFKGKYWEVMMNTTGFRDVLVIRKMDLPTEIFGQRLRPFWKYYHGGDVARMEILMKYGGIYLDTDCYVVRTLDDFRRFEMALAWRPGNAIGNQILIAHKNARFLRLWYNSYKYNYRNNSWSYNSNRYPGHHILKSQPELVHRVDKLFGVYNANLQLLRTNYPDWRDYYTFHLVTSHTTAKNSNGFIKFDEASLSHSKAVLVELCNAVFPFLKSDKYDL